MKKLIFCSILLLFACPVIFGQETNDCPKVEITGPSGVTLNGDTMTFVANVNSDDGDKLGYEWSISGGTIEEGQGTSHISSIKK